ncbi:MAG: hypothetical protein K0S38_51 [Candidatus Paceibacter sp.]|jgi:hypothetical protein|nr:hypothetical protein [Candidatus Paceibacter sp.]
MPTPKNVLIVTSRVSTYTELRDVVREVTKMSPDMGLDKESSSNALSSQTPFDVIVWDKLENDAEIPLIRFAKDRFPGAKMLTIADSEEKREKHMAAGCTHEAPSIRADDILMQLLLDQSPVPVA